MSNLSHLSGITSHTIDTPRGNIHMLAHGFPDGIPVLFVHGNVSCSTFWEETMVGLPVEFRGLAPDLRGYGESARLPVDATRGLRDFSDDLYSLVQTLGLEQVHVVGHSLGGGIALQYTIDYTPTVRSLTLVAPASPFGYGGTKDVHGTPCWQDYAGSGGGIVNPEIVQRLQAGDRSTESDFSPRMLLRNRYVASPYQSPREEVLVQAMLMTSTAEDNYSRDMVLSPNWPFVAPGTRGVNNALSPKYCNLSSFADITPRPPVFWIRGTADQIVADGGLGDPGTLGALGFIPGWPGNERYPPQPMVSQTRYLLERYQANGGKFDECIMEKVGHVPFLEDSVVFLAMWVPFLQATFE